MSELVVGPETQVTLHFSIELEDGSLVDSTREAKPATFRVGDGSLLEGFERALFGLKTGERSRLRILPEQGFGMPNPNNLQRVQRDRFNGMELEPGLMVSFADAGNGELPGVVREVGEDDVVVDFNHPLSGRTLFFDVEIIDIHCF